MEFFKTIADFLQDGQQLQMAIRKSGESIAVSILPDNRGVKDKAVENITPLVMSGTPADFEEGFADALKPLAEAQGLVAKIKEFEENTEKAKRESEMAKKLKDEAAKQKKVLFHAPFFNVGDHVCLGSAKMQKPKKQTYKNWMQYWEDMFWKSEFAHILGANPINGNLSIITKECITSHKPFPTALLKRSKITLQRLYEL